MAVLYVSGIMWTTLLVTRLQIQALVENIYKWLKIVIVGLFHQVGIGNMITEQGDSKFIG
jgi:hypothetical protein